MTVVIKTTTTPSEVFETCDFGSTAFQCCEDNLLYAVVHSDDCLEGSGIPCDPLTIPLSEDLNNQLQKGADGKLYVAPGPITCEDVLNCIVFRNDNVCNQPGIGANKSIRSALVTASEIILDAAPEHTVYQDSFPLGGDLEFDNPPPGTIFWDNFIEWVNPDACRDVIARFTIHYPTLRIDLLSTGSDITGTQILIYHEVNLNDGNGFDFVHRHQRSIGNSDGITMSDSTWFPATSISYDILVPAGGSQRIDLRSTIFDVRNEAGAGSVSVEALPLEGCGAGFGCDDDAHPIIKVFAVTK